MRGYNFTIPAGSTPYFRFYNWVAKAESLLKCVPDPNNPSRITLLWADPVCDASFGGGTLEYWTPNYKLNSISINTPAPNTVTEGSPALDWQPSVAPFRVSRQDILGVNSTAQGGVVGISGIGNLPLWELGYQCLNPSQRQEWRQQRQAWGDTHQAIEFFTNPGSVYDEGGQPYQGMITAVGEFDQAGFLALVEETLVNGMVPMVIYDGDDGDNPDGYPNALRQLPILDSLLKGSSYGDLRKNVLFCRFWDGVFYGSSPANIQNFGTQFRAICPDGFLGIEHQPGRIPVGNGPGDWVPGGMMDAYDILFGEFNNLLQPHDDTIWQVLGRCVRPYIRPSDQPADDDPTPPYYLVDCTRGPRYYCCWEYAMYPWVRVDMADYQPMQAVIEQNRTYLKGLSPSPQLRVA